jgi:hypothetical protein
MPHTSLAILLAAMLSTGASAATAPQGKAYQRDELLPTEAFAHTYPGLESDIGRFPIDLPASREFTVTRAAALCPKGPSNWHPQAFASYTMEIENFNRISRQDVASTQERQYLDWELCDAVRAGQKLNVVRLHILEPGCTVPFIAPADRQRNKPVEHACFYVPIVAYKGQEYALPSDALDGLDAFAVVQLKQYLAQ